MARFTLKNVDNYIAMLGKLTGVTEETVKDAVQAAADILADEVRKNLNGVPTITRNEAVDNYRAGVKSSGITNTAKAGLTASFGITPIRNDSGEWNVHIGFDGYNAVRTKRYPKGQPNQMIARSVEKGSSAVARHPFVAPAIASKKQECIETMQKVIDDSFNEIMN